MQDLTVQPTFKSGGSGFLHDGGYQDRLLGLPLQQREIDYVDGYVDAMIDQLADLIREVRN